MYMITSSYKWRLNHNPTNLKNGPSRFLVSEYPNKSTILYDKWFVQKW